MSRTRIIMAGVAASNVVAVVASANDHVDPLANPVVMKVSSQSLINEPIQPIAPPVGFDADKITLGGSPV